MGSMPTETALALKAPENAFWRLSIIQSNRPLIVMAMVLAVIGG